MSKPLEITQLLEDAALGEPLAIHRLMPIIYDSLRAIAHGQLVHERHTTLTTTALVHETYFALFGESNQNWSNRAHFFAYAASAMRSILIDRARRRLAHKRGSQHEQLPIDEIEIRVDDECVDLLALDQALTQMAKDHPRLVRVVELRFFAGLSVEDTASMLDIDPRSVERDWQKARAFINRELGRAV